MFTTIPFQIILKLNYIKYWGKKSLSSQHKSKISASVLNRQVDIFSILPFDLLCLSFEFSSIYRLNRIVRVRTGCPTLTHFTHSHTCGNISQHSLVCSRLSPSLSSATGWRTSWLKPTSGGILSIPEDQHTHIHTPIIGLHQSFTKVWATPSGQRGDM